MPAAPTRQPSRMQPVLDIDGQRYSLNAPSIVLGRSSDADILIDDTGVSRRHLEIRTGPGTAQAVDLGSTNGSYVNGHKIVGSSELTDGSTITMGRTKIIYRLLPASPGGRQ
jgi:pSer/pThr/pTyr-binding forkhead associated (FHA) protein